MSFNATNFRVHCFDDIFRSVGRMVKRRHWLESPFHGGSNDTPNVVVDSVCRVVRGLECVGLGDSIVGAVIDAVAFSVVSYALLLGRLFVGGKWEVLLAWRDG